MADQEHLNAFLQAAQTFDHIDLAVVLKKNLGDASIYDKIAPLLEEVKSRFPTIELTSEKIDNRSMQMAVDAIKQLNQILSEIGAQTPE